MMPRDQFSRVQTLDVRHALAFALRRLLESLTFDSGGNQFQFSRVFDNWPSWNDQYVAPAACVLPDDEVVYADALLTPTLLEETWEPQDQNGVPLRTAGWALFMESEAECDLSVTVRAPTEAERTALIIGVENAFTVDRVTSDYEDGRRYGRLLPLPEYFGLDGRFALASHRLLDDAETAMRNQWEAIFLVRAQTTKVKVGPVQPFQLRLTQVVGGVPVP